MTALMIIGLFVVALMWGSVLRVIALRSIGEKPTLLSVRWLQYHVHSDPAARGVGVIPWTELACASLLMWVYARFGWTSEGLVGSILVSLGVIVTITDCKCRRIPNKVLLVFLPVIVFSTLINPIYPLWNHLLGAALGLGITFTVALLLRGMGMGDVKLFTLLGWVLGVRSVMIAFLLACILGLLAALILLLAGKTRMNERIPFAPWLMAGTLAVFGYISEILALF